MSENTDLTSPVSTIILDQLCRTTTSTGLQFCPKCGNRTLAKVSVTVGGDGKLRYHFLSEKQFSHKGLRVSYSNIGHAGSCTRIEFFSVRFAFNYYALSSFLAFTSTSKGWSPC